MKKISCLIFISILILGCNSEKAKTTLTQIENNDNTPLEIVNKRMDLYNQHNFTEFIKLYDKEVEIYTYPDKLLGTGTDNIAYIFEPKFAAKGIKVKMSCYIGEYLGELKASSEIERFEWLSMSDIKKVSAVDKIIYLDLSSRGLIE